MLLWDRRELRNTETPMEPLQPENNCACRIMGLLPKPLEEPF